MTSLEERLARLEDDRAIRDLKARYLRACDGKDLSGIRDTLLPHGAVVAFDGFPAFAGRDTFVEVYRQMACVPGVFDIHHGTNGIVSFESADHARGQWSLLFSSINLTNRTVTQMGVEYVDTYLKQDGRWWIAETRSHRRLCLIQTVDEYGSAKFTVMGEPPENFG